MSVTTTYLEMRDASDLRPCRHGDPRFVVREATVRQWPVNRFLYQFIGGPWRWTDKLAWSDDQWQAYVEDERLRTWTAWYDGSVAGYFELLRDAEGGVEIIYFGLAGAFIGRGLGRPLLTTALEAAWSMKPRRVWVHTCSLDHPAALATYQACGMRVYRVDTAAAVERETPLDC